MLRTCLAAAAFLGVWLGAGSVGAHIALIEPAPRTEAQKEGPCGTTGLPRGETVAVYAPGQTITLMWDETIDHDAHYRVALDLDGDDDLVSPDGDDDLYNSATVLVDGIGDDVGGRYVQDVTLPDVECEHCVLQLIQVMYGAGNYFQCADIAIRRGGGPPPAEDPGPAGDPDAGQPLMEEPPASVDDAGMGTGPGVPDEPPAEPGYDPSTGHAYGGCDVASSPGASKGGLLIVALLALVLSFRRRRRG